jgi:hypothetical protein
MGDAFEILIRFIGITVVLGGTFCAVLLILMLGVEWVYERILVANGGRKMVLKFLAWRRTHPGEDEA